MGWNSWDAFGTSVTEPEVKANADAMASELKDFGWQYVVIDEGWYDPNAEASTNVTTPPFAMDIYGRLIPAPKSLSIFNRGQRLQGSRGLYSQQRSKI